MTRRAGRAGPSPSAAYSLAVEAECVGGEPNTLVAELTANGFAVEVTDADALPGLVVSASGEAELRRAEQIVRAHFGPRLWRCTDRVLHVHRGGKLRTVAAVPLATADDLALAYTPGVGRVSSMVAAQPALASRLTARDNTVAVVTDGTAVLGLGDLGPTAALPVMEGKAALFDRLAGINAVPLCLGTTVVDEIVAAVKAVAPSFGAINLEDISAPRCFEIERRLQAALDIPVFHDDQHGTAVVVLAALQNALLLLGKRLAQVRIVVSGAGAAGTAITHALLAAGGHDIVVWAPVGILHPTLGDHLPAHKQELARRTNPRGITGHLADALVGADVFIGVSGPDLLGRDDVARMAPRPILFGLANPQPEFDPADVDDLAAVVATGRSDFSNQINNVLAFPAIFRAALDARVPAVTPAMRRAASDALAELGRRELRADRLLPAVLDPDVVPFVAAAVHAAATSPSAGEAHARR